MDGEVAVEVATPGSSYTLCKRLGIELLVPFSRDINGIRNKLARNLPHRLHFHPSF